MLKKLVSVLALTGLAFGSGLCFNPYNHDYGVNTRNFDDGYLSNYNKTIVLHNGKMQVDKGIYLRLVRYTTNGNKALVLIDAKGVGKYLMAYVKCINNKPKTDDVEELGTLNIQETAVDLSKYPIKLGFYKDGFWVKALTISWIRHLNSLNGFGGFACDYETHYYPYKLIKEHKTYDGPTKDHYLPTGLCQVLGKKYGPFSGD
jgi:hypothetical protein